MAYIGVGIVCGFGPDSRGLLDYMLWEWTVSGRNCDTLQSLEERYHL